METVLKVEDLAKTYGRGASQVNAVRGVSFELAAGEFVAIVGPSGSGKTTLLAMLGGLLTPSSGSIEVNGKDISKMSRSQLARFRGESVGFVFQAGNLLPYLTALENIEVIGSLSSARSVKARAAELIEELGLSGRANAVATELSGGERQRVAIARALVNQPALVLVDEPTASLDSARGEQVVKSLVEEVRTRGTAGIMVTHDMRMAQHAGRVLEMRDGELREGASLAV